MAFVIPTATRKETQKPLQPGPGQYNIEPQYSSLPITAPFNSTTQRKPKKLKPQKQTILPGPGAYDPYLYQQKKVVESSFKSKSTRFQEVHYKTQPGPGSYNPYPQPKHQPNSEPKQNPILSMLFNQNKNRKSQSIKQPSHYVRVVFQNPNNKGSYISQYVDTDFIINKEIGPGQYNPCFQKKTNVPKWSKSKVKRFDDDKPQSNLGPGSYSIQRKKPASVSSASAVFRSQNTRSYFDHNKFKSCHQPYIDLMNKLSIKDSIPGPGQYNLSDSFKQKQSIVQAFGSQSLRFKQTLCENKVGPGSYNFDVKVDRPESLISKLAKRRRCKSELCNKQQEARPHSYDSSNNTLHDNLYKKFKNGYFGNFGCREERFKGFSLLSPGPGNYDIAQKDKQVSTTSYIANSKRKQPKLNDSPFISYNVNIYDISKSLQKKQDFLKNLQLVDVKRPAFQSSAIRFPQCKSQSLVMQQSSHESNNAQNLKEKIKKASAAFSSKTKRGSSLGPSDIVIPPPGYYHRELRMEKISFNMKYGFSEKSQNDRKR